ncbi:MAG: hypothetical protein J4F36_06635 [Nitrosopumilaceae archaeon]|nr:hypothetical protein [Nitrosopumilaceae archaeon]
MKKIGHDFDEHGKITLPKRTCDSCHQEFFFLTTIWQNKQRHRCCDVCKGLDSIESSSKTALLPSVPSRIPVMMAIFAAFGIMLMIGGFAYVMLVAPQQESSILHVIIGSCMSGAGFMLARKMVKVRNMILGKNSQLATEELR